MSTITSSAVRSARAADAAPGSISIGRDSEAVPVLVLGNGITALGVVRRLAGIGVRSYVVADDPDFVRASRWFHRLDPAPPKPDRLAEWLDRLELDRAVLVPCSDTWVLAVAALPPEISERFPASVPPAETARTLVDKASFARFLHDIGVPHPATVEIDDPSDLDALGDDVLDGGFLKPTHSQPFFQAFNRKALLVEGRADARRMASEALARGLGITFQQMVHGPAENQLCVDGFVDSGGTIRGLFARQWLRKYPADFGESTLAVSVALEDVAEAVDLATRIMRALPYRGVFSVELKKDSRDQRYRVLEVNARPWWYVGFTCRAGVDVCTMAYRDALGLPVSNSTSYRAGLRVAYPELDWHAARELPGSHTGTSLPRLLWTWLGATQPIFTWNDPGPAMAVFRNRVRRRLARLLAPTSRGS